MKLIYTDRPNKKDRKYLDDKLMGFNGDIIKGYCLKPKELQKRKTAIAHTFTPTVFKLQHFMKNMDTAFLVF